MFKQREKLRGQLMRLWSDLANGTYGDEKFITAYMAKFGRKTSETEAKQIDVSEISCVKLSTTSRKAYDAVGVY
jgi:hypothetical protein